MSFKFLKKIWEGIKKAFEKLAPELKSAIHIGVTVVDNIKNFVDSPGADILTALIPGDLDDKIKIRLRATLPKILIEMKLADRCADQTDPAKIVLCAVETLQKIGGDWISDDAKKNFYDSLAVLIAQVAADGKLSWDDSKYILKWYYDHVKKAS
jgi:hypothetical protein